mmetsp:Transcript_60569/g.141849  ORF Transcript_60569/g.141849 Transcript_60569/m.141849 type:complete len:84 (+) Transcript_60569:119-370(+)
MRLQRWAERPLLRTEPAFNPRTGWMWSMIQAQRLNSQNASEDCRSYAAGPRQVMVAMVRPDEHLWPVLARLVAATGEVRDAAA